MRILVGGNLMRLLCPELRWSWNESMHSSQKVFQTAFFLFFYFKLKTSLAHWKKNPFKGHGCVFRSGFDEFIELWYNATLWNFVFHHKQNFFPFFNPDSKLKVEKFMHVQCTHSKRALLCVKMFLFHFYSCDSGFKNQTKKKSASKCFWN